MERGNRRRRTRSSSGSALDQTNGGGEVTPPPDKVSQQQSNVSVLLPLKKTPEEAESLPHMNDLKESTNEEQHPTTASVTVKKSSGTKFSGSHRELVLGLPCRGQFEIKRSSKKLGAGGGGGKKNVVMVSSHKRAQRSKEAATPVSSVNGSKKRKDYISKVEVREDDEYTRIKKKLRYFLNRISYEQSLIDAYSLEGWKGSSAEKLRPEKELERAKKEILRRKVKIRELIQHLDTLCAEGNIPESLFNSDGEISSEDIFCSKCGSEELHVDNDIILCDGFCDRGFHQYCVQPPLRKEDIPPDDESWLCPGCACKDYSFDLLNDSLGTKLSVSDSWEKVFPEAAAAMAGGGSQNLDCDLPSDDSEDEEYDPDGLNDAEGDGDGSDDSDDDESENEDGSSDESASDVMIGSFKDAKDIMNLPSDDSEDDDYDPDAPTRDEDVMQESSNSDDSDSEDVETSSKGNESGHQDKVTPRGKLGRKKAQLSDVSISESDAGIGDDDVPGRRKVERLDYKKLYDEEYENVPTSSSDDEDWDKIAGKEDSESADEGDTVPLEQPSKAEDRISTQKPKREYKKATLIAPQETPPPRENGCCSVEKSISASSKQTNPKTQRLFESFHENRYPDVTTRENLAKELQMTVKQVNNWFRNTRFSTSKTMSSKEDVEKLRTDKECEGETSVAGSSKQAMETEPIAENKNGASESTSTGSRKRRRR